MCYSSSTTYPIVSRPSIDSNVKATNIVINVITTLYRPTYQLLTLQLLHGLNEGT